jgi:hypothetical protein
LKLQHDLAAFTMGSPRIQNKTKEVTHEREVIQEG